MIANDCVFSASDRRALEKLNAFLPDKIFDAHFHPGRSDFCPVEFAEGSHNRRCGDPVTMAEYIRDQGALYGGNKKLRANMIIFPDPEMKDRSRGLRDASTRFLAEELDKYPQNVGEVIVLPDDTKADVEAQLIHPGIRGFKCYHFLAQKEGTWQCGIEEYLPEAAWQVADERGFCITLHMVRDLALADDGNRSYICRMAKKYPNAKLILAHAARGFAAWTAVENVGKLADLPNVLFDFAAVCEADPLFAIVKTCGIERVMWGTDYPVSTMRGKCISIADSFLWLYKEQLEQCASNTSFDADLIGIENLLAARTACMMLELDRQGVEDFFYNNAMRLFGLTD